MYIKPKRSKNPPLKERDCNVLLRGIGQPLLARVSLATPAAHRTKREGYLLLRGVGQALLAGGLIRQASSALNRKGGLLAARGSRPGPSGRGPHTPSQQRTEQKGRVDEI
jgi:hypothetical protein